MVKRITIRRCVFWFVLIVGVVGQLLVRMPISPYITVQGRVVGGNAYLYAISGTAIVVLLLWCALFVRAEPVLVRIALLVIGVPLAFSMAAELWRLISFTAHGNSIH